MGSLGLIPSANIDGTITAGQVTCKSVIASKTEYVYIGTDDSIPFLIKYSGTQWLGANSDGVTVRHSTTSYTQLLYNGLFTTGTVVASGGVDAKVLNHEGVYKVPVGSSED